MISTVVLTRNEEENIERCLRSLSWCDEILVIDDFSSDRTIGKIGEIEEIREKVKIIQNKSTGSMAQIRNFALEKSQSGWVFFVDADEVVPDELGREVARQTGREKDDKFVGFYVQRKDFFMGKFLKYGETGKIKLLRLGRKNSGQWTRGVHETWEITGEVGEITNYLEHYSHPTIKQFIDSMNRWADFDANELNREGKKFEYYRVFLNPLGKFILNYFLKFGFLDGYPGFVMAYMMSLQSLIVRVKQYEQSKST